MRLHQVAYATQAHKDTGRAVGARSLSDIAGFAPATLHALGVRVSTEVMRKPYDLIVTNVPGPRCRCTPPEPGWPRAIRCCRCPPATC